MVQAVGSPKLRRQKRSRRPSQLGLGREEEPAVHEMGRASATLFVHVLMGAGHA